MSTYPKWFGEGGEELFSKYLSHYSTQSNVNFLQLGAYTGDASVWMLENLLNETGTLYDVDTWEGSDEGIHRSFDWVDVEAVYDAKTEPYRDRLVKCKGTTTEFLLDTDDTFDFIYVDADHTALSAFADGALAMNVINVGGIIAFDDYTWRSGKGDMFDPWPGIEKFLEVYEDRVTVIEKKDQVWVQT